MRNLQPETFNFGGAFNISKETEDYDANLELSDIKSSAFQLSPNVGFFVNDNVVVGGVISYQSTTTEGDYDGGDVEISQNIFSVGPYFRYYKPLGETAAFFVQGSLLFGFGGSEADYGDDFEFEEEISTIDFAIKPGFSFFLNEHWGIEGTFGGLGYSKATSEPKEDSGGEKSSSDKVYLTLSLSSFSLGVQYYIGR